MPQIRNGGVCVAVLLAGFAAAFISLQPVPPPPAEVQTLPEPVLPDSTPREVFPAPTAVPTIRRLELGAVHTYPLIVKSGYCVELLVEQHGTDLQVVVRDADRASSFTVDSPIGEDGSERVFLAPEETRIYRVEVSGRSSDVAGSYAIYITEDRPAARRDRMEARAEAFFYQGKEALKSGDLRSPEPKLREAVRLWDGTGNTIRGADALKVLGDLFRAQSKWEESLDVLKRATSLFHLDRRFADEGLAAIYTGFALEKLARLEEAWESYRGAVVLGERSENPERIAVALYNLGNLERRQSRSGEALEHLHRAKVIWDELDNPKGNDALAAIGGVFAEAGEIEKAMARLNQASATAVASGDSKQHATVLSLMGNALWRTNPERSRTMYDKAARIQRQLGYLDDLAATLNGIGLLHLNRREYQEALAPLQQALRIYRQTNSRPDEARTFTNLGFVFAGLRRDRDARTAYESAISQAGLDRFAEAVARTGLAQLERQLGNPIEARNQAEAAVRNVETMRAASRSDLRVSLLANRQGIYGTLIENLMWQHEFSPKAGFVARAFGVSELARTRGLLDSVSGLETRPGVIPSPADLAVYQSQLDSDTLLLEYHLGRSAGYLWVMDRTFLHVFKLPPREKIERLADDARRLLPSRGRNLSEARRVATELSRVLLMPAAPFLGRKRLVLSVPDLLQGIPFGVLPDPRALNLRTGRELWQNPLIVHHEIVKIPSLSVLTALRRRDAERTPPPDLLAILFDPVYDLTDERLETQAKVRRSGAEEAGPSMDQFARLRYAEEEAKAILGAAGPRGVLTASGFDATRDFVLNGNLRDVRNIHFTSHGRLQAQDAGLSALVLSQLDQKGRPIEGFLRASDIVRLDLPADLVVLSACETGLGERIPGEGLVGLPQAFIAAGATRVLVSLWPVEDLASSKLMTQFYREYLVEGRSPAAALRQAQIAMWQTRRHGSPFFWGAFELQGDWRPAGPSR